MDSTPGTGCSGNRMLPGGDEEEGHRITSLRRSDPRWSGIVRPEIRLTHRWRKPDSNVSSHSRQFLSEAVERCAETKWWARGEFLRAGTVGSNPSPSSGESSELRFRAHTLQGQGERRDPSLSVAARM